MALNELNGAEGEVNQSPEQLAAREVADLPKEVGDHSDLQDLPAELDDMAGIETDVDLEAPLERFPAHLTESRERYAPRQLEKTEQRWREEPDGSRIFDSPEETGSQLDIRQGCVSGYRGTCGLVSCENVLCMAGLEITEEDVVERATSRKPPLCTMFGPEDCNGGTTCFGRKKLLDTYGVPSCLRLQSSDTIAEAVESGKGVILSVDAGKFYDMPEWNGAGHAVTAISVKRGPDREIQGFYICDSNSGELGETGSKYVEASKLEWALTPAGLCNITKKAIR